MSLTSTIDFEQLLDALAPDRCDDAKLGKVRPDRVHDSGLLIIVGIDVSKDRLDVEVRSSGDTFATDRNAAGLEQLVAYMGELSPHVIALEATGGFEIVVAAALEAAGLRVAVVNPAQVRAFAKAIGQRAKTDPIDARVIAHFAEATNLEP